MAIKTAPAPQPAADVLSELKRKDGWWVRPLVVALTLIIFSIYAGFRGFENANFSPLWEHGDDPLWAGKILPHYLSPFYSPPIFEWIGGHHWALSPALFVLIFPLSFRATCYFCRRTYYRAFFGDPYGCAVPEVLKRANYTGERNFPWNVQNLHRYSLYFILIVTIFHWMHLAQSFFYSVGGQPEVSHFGPGLGTLILAIDATTLTLYVISCHSFRHLIGGILNRFSVNPGRYKLWKTISGLNENHGLFFWISLVSVGVADVYIRLVTSGAITDIGLRAIK